MLNNEFMGIKSESHHVVGVSDMKVAKAEGVIVTHSLGSCIGIAIHDPAAQVSGILHFQLPSAEGNKEKAALNPCMYADTGIPELFRSAYRLGADKRRIIVKVAGGSNIADKNDFFKIGSRNYIMMKKIFWKNGILIDNEDVGGNIWRTMRIEIRTGRVFIKHGKGEYEL
ncbi:MAG: chemotaxis protein CheD [bacterium]